MGHIFPLKGPVENVERHNVAWKLFSRIPIIRQWVKFSSQREIDRHIAASLRAQLSARSSSDVDRSWIRYDSIGDAILALSESLRKLMGWETDKIIADDPIKLLLFNENDLDIVEFQIDIENWLGKKIDPQFFNHEFMKFTFKEAVEWLEKTKSVRK